MLKVSVTTVPEKGKANQAIVRLLARQLGLKKSDIRLVRGRTSSGKTFQITGIDRQKLAKHLKEILAPNP